MGGLGIVLPMLLLFLILEEVLHLAATIAAPIAVLLFSKSVLESAWRPVLGAIGFFAVALMLGLIANTKAGKCLGRAIERNTLERVPVYNALKGIARGLVGDGHQHFRPVPVGYGDDTAAIGFLVEEIDDERVAVLELWVPTPMAGNIKIMRIDS